MPVLMRSNAAVQRPRDTLSSAARVHNEVAHMRRPRRRVTVRCNCLLGCTIYVVIEPREATTQARAKHHHLMGCNLERYLHHPDTRHCGCPALVQSQPKPVRKQLTSFHTAVTRPTLVVALDVDLGHPSAVILFIEPIRTLKGQVAGRAEFAIGEADENVVLSILDSDVSSMESWTHANDA